MCIAVIIYGYSCNWFLGADHMRNERYLPYSWRLNSNYHTVGSGVEFYSHTLNTHGVRLCI